VVVEQPEPVHRTRARIRAMPAERRDTGVDYDTAAVDYDRTRGRAVTIGTSSPPSAEPTLSSSG
jgi:hypothetical protein